MTSHLISSYTITFHLTISRNPIPISVYVRHDEYASSWFVNIKIKIRVWTRVKTVTTNKWCFVSSSLFDVAIVYNSKYNKCVAVTTIIVIDYYISFYYNILGYTSSPPPPSTSSFSFSFSSDRIAISTINLVVVVVVNEMLQPPRRWWWWRQWWSKQCCW